jgi:hypothetical protein
MSKRIQPKLTWSSTYEATFDEPETEIRIGLAMSITPDGAPVCFAEVTLNEPGAAQSWECLTATSPPHDPVAALHELIALCLDAARDEHPISWQRAAACVTTAADHLKQALSRGADVWTLHDSTTQPIPA